MSLTRSAPPPEEGPGEPAGPLAPNEWGIPWPVAVGGYRDAPRPFPTPAEVLGPDRQRVAAQATVLQKAVAEAMPQLRGASRIRVPTGPAGAVAVTLVGQALCRCGWVVRLIRPPESDATPLRESHLLVAHPTLLEEPEGPSR